MLEGTAGRGHNLPAPEVSLPLPGRPEQEVEAKL